MITFIDKDEQSGEGPLELGAKACASGLGSEVDVFGRIGLPVPNAPLEFWAYNAEIGPPGAGLNQEINQGKIDGQRQERKKQQEELENT
jgi:hypothetical protein